ncbi:hypothetical protein GQ42DRAFT_164007 [Ramicandelaber brevisporus]|nr:hypothetical protein GQ42DRAFT_164007 [Ramicandelaber brevisporus]
MLFNKLATKGKRSWRSFVHRFRHNEQQEHHKHTEHIAQQVYIEHTDASTNSTTTAATTTPPLPDRLFVLPYDLLELMAIAYFRPREALKVLCVNSQFYEAFARRVWRRPYLDDARLNKISDSAWKNYGHLVRVVIFGYDVMIDRVDATLLPNLVGLRLLYSQLVNSSFGQAEFPKLRRLHLEAYLDKWTSSETIQCVNTIQKWIQQSDYSISAYWVIYATANSSQINLKALDDMLSKIGVESITHYKFSVTLRSQDPVTLTQLPLLANSLTVLNVSESRFGFDCFFNHNNNNITYPRLRVLNIKNSNLLPVKLQHWMSNITPNRLPNMKDLVIVNDRGAINPSWFIKIFEHTWPTLTSVDIQRCYSAMDFQTVISHTPNLLQLYLRECTFTLVVSTLATYVSRLNYLSLGSMLTIDLDIPPHQQPQNKLSDLKSLDIMQDYDDESSASIAKNALQFIIHVAPSLRRINTSNLHGIPESYFNVVRGMVNPAVRELGLYAHSSDPDPKTVLCLAALFPNLTLVDISGKYGLHETKNLLTQKYPKLTIICHSK